MLNWKKLTWKHLFLLLLILHLAPLWIFTYFPSQDGPSHTYNAFALKEYHKHENYTMRDVWKLNITIFPNWLSHITLAALLYIFPPILAEKILLTLAVGLVPISFFYFLNAVHNRGVLFGWLGFLFSYNYLLFMGFYNFALSISFFFFSFGYWWKHKDNLRVNHLIVLYLLLLVTYLCHIVSYGLVLLGMSVAATGLWAGEAIAKTWRERNIGNPASMLVGFVAGLKPLLRFFLYMVPVYFVLMDYYLQSLKDYQSGNHKGMDWISDYFWGVKSIVYFADRYVDGSHMLWGLAAAIIIFLIFHVWRRQWWLRLTDSFFLLPMLFFIGMFIETTPLFNRLLWASLGTVIVLSGFYCAWKKQWLRTFNSVLLLGLLLTVTVIKTPFDFTDGHFNDYHVLLWILGTAIVASVIHRIHQRQWFQATDSFLLIAILFTIMFIKAPWGFGYGGWINDRIHLYIPLMLAAWLVPDMRKFLRYGFTGVLVAICLIHLGRSTYDHARLNREIAELTSGVKLIEPHTTFAIRSPDWNKSEALGRVEYVTPFAHSMAFYGLYADDIGHLANYEANYNYFPINKFNTESYNGKEDYIIAWAYPAQEKFGDLTPNYDLIYETQNLKLFRRKRAEEPDLSVWSRTPDERLIIHFDMQPNGGATADGHHAIEVNTAYISGKFGWVTQSPHNARQGGKGIAPRARDSVWDIDDAAFKLDLPNGTYRVTNYFNSAEGAVHEVNLLANGKRVIKKLIVPAGNETIERSYTVIVTEGHLTQVIYTPKKRVLLEGKHNHWVWSGFTVEQLPAKENEK